MDVARLQIVVDSNQAKKADRDLQKLEKQSKRNEKSNLSLTKSNRVLGQSIFTLKNLIGTVLVGTLIKGADEIKLLEGRMQQATRSTDEFAKAWAGLNAQAASISGDLSAGVEIFQRISFSRDEIKASVDDMLQFTGTVQKLGVVSGASTGALKAGLTQLGQALSSDVARAEEFNSIMENIPVVGKAIAEEFGVTTGQLRRLVIEGEVLSEDVFAAILNQTERANEQFEKMPLTVGRATQQLWHQFKILVSGVDDVTNSTSLLASFIQKITEAVKALTVIVRFVGFAFEEVATRGAAALLDTVNDIIDGVNRIIQGLNKIKPGDDFGTVGRIGGGEAGERTFFNEANAATAERANDLINEINKLFPAQEQLSTSTRKVSQDYKALAESLTETDDEAEKAAEKIAKVIEQLEFNTEQLQRTNIEQEIYNNLRAAGTERDTEAGQRIEQLTRAYEGMSEELRKQERVVDDLGDAFVDNFNDAITGAKSFGDALANLFGELQQIILQMTVLEPLKQSLTGAFSGGGGGLFGSLFSGIGSFFGGGSSVPIPGIKPPVPGLATGGDITIGGNSGIDKNQLSINGVPVADVSKGETISVKPNGAGGSAGNVYNIDARGAEPGVEERIMAVLKQMDRSFEERSRNAVAQSLSRDPTYGGRN